MSKLPTISGNDLIKYLSKKGFVFSRQRGSHVVLKKSNDIRVTVPLHPELDRGTLLGILEQAGIDRDEFIQEWYG